MQVLLQFFRTSPCFSQLQAKVLNAISTLRGLVRDVPDYSGRVPSIAGMQEMTQLRKATIGAYTAPTQVSVVAD